MEGTVEGTPKDSPEALAQIQQKLNGAVITVRPTGGSTPEIVFAVVPGDTQLAGGVRVSVDQSGNRLDNCAGRRRRDHATDRASAPSTTSTTSTSTTAVPAARSRAPGRGLGQPVRISLGDDCPGPRSRCAADHWRRGGPLRCAARRCALRRPDGRRPRRGGAQVRVLCDRRQRLSGDAQRRVHVRRQRSRATRGRVHGNEATIVGDAVQTTESIWGPNDPRCCPSSTARTRGSTATAAGSRHLT